MIGRFSRSFGPDSAAALLGHVLVALMLGVVAGIVSASGNINAVGSFSALIIAFGMLMSRNALLWLIVFGGLVIVGATQLYFPEIRHIRYVLPLTGFGLILHGLFDRLRRPVIERPRLSPPKILPWAAAFAIVALSSLLINFDTVGAAILGMKTYFQMWPFLVGLVLVRWGHDRLPVIAKAMLAIAFLQLPFVVHQYFYLVPMRRNLLATPLGFQPVDVVAGTFGAHMYGGGANAVLAAFMIIAVACLVGLWKRGMISPRNTAIMTMLFLFPLLLNQAKISALYLISMYVVLFYQELVRKPLRFLAVSGIMVGLFALLMTAMTLTHPRDDIESWSDLINYTIERQQTSVHEREGHFSELTRLTALTFWLEEHTGANPIYALLGHGPGASRVQDQGLDLAETLAEEEYQGLQIGYTAVSSLLWDTGIIGLAMIIGMFVSAFRTAGWLSKHYDNTDPFRAGLFDGLRVAMVVLTISLAHKDFFIYHIPYQTLVLLIIGVLVISARRAASSDAESLDN